ncbi:MAG: CHAT domain-containing protein, partial [Thermoguttaceae bacterium]|nr:CHAT domain-containing protein [Thermoguttaceae bacterium]
DKILCRAISIFESKDLSGESLGVDLYDLRAKTTTLLWGQEDLHAGATSSLPPFSRILEDRRKAFENSLAADDYTEKSNMVIELIQELKQAREYDEIYDVVNKIRFQRFYDRLKLASTDLLATLPADIAAPLNRQRQELYADCTRLERELVRTLQSDRDQKDYLNTYLRKEALLHEKRKEILALNRKIEDLSPIWRKIKGKRDSERSYQEIKLALTQTETIVLQYLINEKGALSRMTEEITPCHFLLAYGHGLKHPILYSLKIDEKTAKRINELVPEADSAEGYLSTDLLNRLLQNRSKTGLLDRIFAKDDSDATIELSHILWKILVPSVALRKKLTDGLSFRHVLIMPDGPLTKLSFEALVTDPDDRDQCYFLDNGPKISYTFSPAGLGTARKSKAEKYHSLLTLGNANYEQFMRFFDSSASPAKKKDSSFHVFDPRILAGMGKFKALHYSKAEVESIAQLGRERNLQVTSILGNDATEQRFRSSCAGKSIIHLACHGFTDSRWENVFGGLLLTPVDENNEKNDGFLAANEITNMDLRETQLAILSACETNLGEFSHEEGVMSMSRAFMIAGCRNVLTSNWSVDDEATMTLVYHFLDRVLGAAEDNECDLADALRNAKLFLRKFSDLRELKKPFYWAPFVLWGYD